jgi:hypothetical protein
MWRLTRSDATAENKLGELAWEKGRQGALNVEQLISRCNKERKTRRAMARNQPFIVQQETIDHVRVSKGRQKRMRSATK